jgi:periplasmic protein TonB
MLDQLVESKNTSAENTRRSEFILGTLVILVTVLVGSWVYSLFNKEYGMGTGDLDISSLVAPVALPEDAPPPPPEPEQKPERQQTTNDNEKPTVIEKIARIEDSLDKPPDVKEARKLNSSPLSKSEANQYSEGSENKYRGTTSDREGTNDGGGIQTQQTAKVEDDEPKIEVKKKEEPKPEPKPVPKTISGGVVNGKATNLVKPPYPAAARAVRAAGAVNVQVTIDENGNVISASAVSGHPLLRAAAVQAARSSKFSPTMLSGQAVKVTGVIVYNFVP